LGTFTSLKKFKQLLHKHIIPLFADFEDTNKNIERILNGSLKGYALLYYIYYFGGK